MEEKYIMEKFNKRNIMLHILRRYCVGEMWIDFDGGGDSGQVTGAYGGEAVDTLLGIKASDVVLTVMADFTDPAYGSELMSIFKEKQIGRAQTMGDILDDWAYDLLEETNYDWVNNEGGYGTLHIDVDGETVRCDMSIRVTNTEDHEIYL